MKNIMHRFVIPQELVNTHGDIRNINYCDSSSQLESDKIHICIATRSRLKKLQEEGGVAPAEVSKFMKGIMAFYEAYALGHLPLKMSYLNVLNLLISQKGLKQHSHKYSGLLPYSDIKNQELLFNQSTRIRSC